MGDKGISGAILRCIGVVMSILVWEMLGTKLVMIKPTKFNQYQRTAKYNSPRKEAVKSDF
jgi:hypothetical protein